MKDMLSGIGGFVFVITIGLGWIYNLVWIIDNWEHLSTVAKMIDVVSVFFFPLGAFLGIIHFF